MSAYPKLLDEMMDAILARDLTSAPTLYRDKKDFPPTAQLAVYVEGYRLRLYEVLEATYPATLHALGPKVFRTLAEDFIEATPSRVFNLDKYPLPFSEHVKAHADAFAGEVAQLESAIHAVYQAPESPALSPQWAASQTPDALASARLMPRAASSLLAFSYPVNDYVAALREGQKPAKPEPAANRLMVLRHRHQVNRLALSQAEYRLLSLFAGGRTLEQALEDEHFSVFATQEHFSADLTGWFARWVKEGMLTQS